MQWIASFKTFDAAYVACLRSVYESYEFVNAPRGIPSRELLNVSFLLMAPRERVPYLGSRKTNIIFNFAHALWCLSGRDDLESIAYYAPTLHRFSADGHRLTGSAYGPRIFGPGAGTARPQWEQVAHLLREDPDSKRAVIQIFDSSELLVADNIDVSCTLALQFFIRDRRLHATCYMRANNAFQGIVGDVFSNTFLQEFLATQLGLPMGSYAHHVGSMHVIDADLNRVEKVLDEAARRLPGSLPFRFPTMPATTSWDDIRQVHVHEAALRQDKERLTPAKIGRGGLAPYWQQVLLLFELYREIIHDQVVDRDVYDALLPGFQYLVSNKWKLVQSQLGADDDHSAGSSAVDWRRWTIVLLKPDCIARGLVDEVLDVLREDVRIVAKRAVTVTEDRILRHYADLVEDPELLAIDVRTELRRMYLGRQVVVALAEGQEAATTVRRRLGHSDPARASPATIRGRFGIDSFARARQEGRLTDNVIHSSDTCQDVERDFKIWFGPEYGSLL